MAQAIQTSKFGTLDTSGRIPVYLAGAAQDNTTPALNLGLGFTVNGQKYTFIPEDRITTGSATSNQGRIYPGFLNPQLLSNLKNTAEYVDISGTQFGNFDIGNFIAQQMGGSTKGYLAKEENVQPIIDAGVTFYDPSITGRVTGLGSANGQPAYIMPSGNSYLTPDGRIATTTRQLVGWRESGGLGGLGSFLASIDPSSALSQAATQLFQPVEKAVTAGVADVSKALSTDDAKKAMAVGAAFFVPGVGSAIGQSLVNAGVITGAAVPYATAIGTAIASTTSQVAQGVPLEQALSNATTNAVVSTAAPGVAQSISKIVTYPQVADAITSAGASAFKTAIAGGSAADIEKNMTAALAGSAATSLYADAENAESVKTGRAIGSAIGGSITGGAMGASLGAAGELGRPETPPVRPPLLASADTDVVSDAPTPTEEALRDVVVTGSPDIQDTSIITPDTSISPKDKAVIDATGIAAEPSLPKVTVTAKPEIEDTSIITPDATVTTKEEISVKPVTEEDKTPAEDEETKEKPYKPELFIYGGTAPKPKSRTTTDLGTTLQAPFYPSTTLGQALTGYRGAGEIEGKKTGKPRRDVWNEESLRLKDALGL
jgi:hypothetical protein